MRYLSFSFFLLLFLAILSFRSLSSDSIPVEKFSLDRTSQKAKSALEFCKNEGLSQDLAILVDMSLHSGLKRMIVWDFKGDSVLMLGMVSHGCGQNN